MAGRIQKSIKNAQVNVMFYVITMILAFFSRKVFLDNLGTEFLGLSSTLGDILNLMNITELGIGTAVGVTLYKPLFDDDRSKISDIISVYGFLYSRIGVLIAAVSMILSCFFPMMFKDIDMPLGLVYFMFYSIVYGALLSYFVNYRQIILSASQNNYVIMYRYQTINVVKILLQMACSFLPYCFIWWICMELVAGTINSVILHWSVKKRYPWLDTSIKLGKAKFQDYKDLWVKTQQVFAFKISHLIFNGSINILIAAFVNLSMVAMFGNYNMLMSKVTAFFDGFFTSMGASIGNLIAEGNKEKMMKVFYELMSIRYFIAGLCSITMYFAIPKLIVIWLGEQYILPTSILVLMSIHTFILQARLTVTNFKDAYGLFQDVWAPITEVVIAIVGSIILGNLYGLLGILIAFIVADFLIKICWQPYYLFKHGFEISAFKSYLPTLVKYIVILAIAMTAIFGSEQYISKCLDSDSVMGALIYCIAIGCSVLGTLTILFACLDKNFRNFANHMISYKKGSR